MLVELSIENLGVIERVHLMFEAGFTAFTGETGAGKTMLVEAINLVVGRRADASIVREGATEARIEARFVNQSGQDGEETILSRVVSAEGRSRAYINGRMATIAALAEAGAELVDIHGQHSHQRLLSASHQRSALDVFAGVDLEPLKRARAEVTEIDAHLAALGGDEKSRAREIDLLRFQCEEIEGARLADPGEDSLLESQEAILADVQRHREAMWSVVGHIGDDGNVIEGMRAAIRSTSGVHSLSDTASRLEAVLSELSDIYSVVRADAESLEEDPVRLEEIRARRQLLRELRRKYGDTLEDVITFGGEARRRLDELEGYADRVADLLKRRGEALAELLRQQQIVGDQRRRHAAALGRAVEERLRDLDLANSSLGVSVGEPQEDPAGESVSFMFAANPGSSPQPLAKVASGGELARVMLALRLVLSEDPGTMVFDEVDAGIGGAAAVAVASALRELGSRHQVFAVTHLPQVAAAAHEHIAVSKSVSDGRTYGTARTIDLDDRVGEVARMLSGGIADESAVAHARDLVAELATKDRRPGGS